MDYLPLKIYYADDSDTEFAKSLFVDTPYSAYHNITFPVLCISAITGICFLISILFFYPYHTRYYFLGTVAIIIFICPIIIKWFVIFLSLFNNNRTQFFYPPLIEEDILPIYSVLIPLYKERKIFPDLKRHIEQIDYPIDKLDIILLLEQDDTQTITTVQRHLKRSNPSHIKQLIIPKSFPRTKPKALNIALNYLEGDYFVIFDAEDRPEPDQLKKAASYFSNLPTHVGALQAKLSYHNPYKTKFLTRMFWLEYEIWFNHFLPGLIKLKLPIPLSGTSTHMRTKDILKIGGWDAYNVTEDCDLGIRLDAAGYKTLILDSYTYEEAPDKLTIWIKQRTRWMRGYLQTLITHLRNPIRAYNIFGFYKLLGIYAIVGGQVFSALLHPICWLFFILGFNNLVQSSSSHNGFQNDEFTILLYFLTFTGFLLPIFQASLTLYHIKKNYSLGFFSIIHVFYWFLAGIAAYRAVWQLKYCPFLWEKTPHGNQ